LKLWRCQINIEIYPKRVFTYFLFVILLLLSINILGIISKYYFGHDNVYGLVKLFDFDTEKNIPTFYSTIALFFVSVLLLFITLAHKKLKSSYFPWLGLAIIFLFLSVDEFVSIHERFTTPVSKLLIRSCQVHPAAWTIPYGIALIVLIIVYFKFLMGLPRRIRNLFLLSGAIFVTGAVGFEFFGGHHVKLYGEENFVFSLFYTCEEFLEMLGIALFIYTLLLYISTQFRSLTMSFREQK